MRASSSGRTKFPARRKLLPEALVAVLVVRLLLAVVPIAVWRRLSDRLRRRAAGAAQRASTPADIAWAVRRASRAVPGASCLTQSLAAQIVLARHGHESRLNLGVARDATGEFRAHAWLESDGRIVVGAREREGYTLLLAGTRASNPAYPRSVHLSGTEHSHGEAQDARSAQAV